MREEQPLQGRAAGAPISWGPPRDERPVRTAWESLDYLRGLSGGQR